MINFLGKFRLTSVLLNHHSDVIKPIVNGSIPTTTSTTSKRLPPGYNPPTTFAIYVQENIQKGVVSKVEFLRLSKQWKALPDHEKERFHNLQKLKATEKLTKFNELPEHEQQRKIQEHHERRSQIILFKFFEKTEYPKCPLSIFDVYKRSLEPGKYSIDEIKEHFDELTDDQMKQYVSKFMEEMDDYHHAVKKWKRNHGHKFDALKKKLHHPKLV